jgi:hypothetical protein
MKLSSVCNSVASRALIDGDRSFAKVLRDFENLEALAASSSIIAIHDVRPHDMDARAVTSKAETAFQTGDVGNGLVLGDRSEPMSALGQKQTHALQQKTSLFHPATLPHSR